MTFGRADIVIQRSDFGGVRTYLPECTGTVGWGVWESVRRYSRRVYRLFMRVCACGEGGAGVQ